MAKLVSEQIEETADWYAPAVYQLLSFHQTLQAQNDPLDGKFIPLTSVKWRSPSDTKIMAIGLLPPSHAAITKVLDRSASIRALAGADGEDSPPGDLPNEQEKAPVRTTPFVPAAPGAGLVDKGSLGKRRLAVPGGGLISEEDLRSRKGNLAGVFNEKRHSHTHQGIDIAAPVGSPIKAPDKGKVVDITADGVRDGYGNTLLIQHENGQLSFYAHLDRVSPDLQVGKEVTRGMVVAYVGKTHEPDTNNMGAHLHFEVLPKGGGQRPDGHIAIHRDLKRIDPVPWLDAKRSGVASAVAKPEVLASAPIVQDAPTTKDWNESGKQNANKASALTAQAANSDLNLTNLGRAFAAAQRATIKLLLAAYEQMAKTPPLRMLVNPQSFKVSMEKVVASANWDKIVEHWGDNQDKIEASGKIAAFYSMEDDGGDLKPGMGLSRTARQYSASYQNFLSLFLLYKNNGTVWLPDPGLPRDSRIMSLATVGSVYVYYDEVLYIGSFDNLTINEDEDQPFTLDYSFTFTVRAWYVLDHVDEPRYTYGRASPPVPVTNDPHTDYQQNLALDPHAQYQRELGF